MLSILFVLLTQAWAETDIDCFRLEANCSHARASSPSANPSTSNRARSNPSAVPIEDGFGFEFIGFKSNTDYGFVKGNGRVGAAFSPSNSEETFFGSPGFELPENMVTRKQNGEKYPNQKYTLATAMSIFNSRGSGWFGNLSLNLGIMGKYNQLTRATTGGGGISGLLGPLTYGYSYYRDETQLDYSIYGLSTKDRIQYSVETYNVGLVLGDLILDYSRLNVLTADDAKVSLSTMSYYLSPVIIILSKRTEESNKPNYNYVTKSIEQKPIKDEYFGGIQMKINSFLIIGALYNYYLLREVSATATIFF